ncbi:hypothetical protein ABID99_003999 [Mucilaginibacter sp. OAE612]
MVYKLHNKCNVLLLAFTVIFSPAIVGYYHQQINIQTKNAAAWLRLSGNYSPASGRYTPHLFTAARGRLIAATQPEPSGGCNFFSLFFKE